jgi:hypothetical protein
MELQSAKKYPRAADPGALLPIVFGDFLSSDASSSASAFGGATPAVCIDVDNWVFCVNALPSDPSPPLVFVEQVLQAPSVYTYTPAVDYGAVSAIIAIIQFTVNPGGRQISVRMRGTVNNEGQLITNPIDAIQIAFTEVGTWELGDFDRTSIPEARRAADWLGYPIHWCFVENRSYKEWLTEILINYFGNHFLTPDGHLGIVIELSTIPAPEALLADLDARVHIDAQGAGDPDDAITYELDAKNLVQKAILRYQYQWHTGEYTQEKVYTDARSLSRYSEGLVSAKEFTLPGVRLETHADQWAAQLFGRYAIDPATVTFAVRSLRYLHLTPPSYITLTWAYGPNRAQPGWSRRILKILNTTYQLPSLANLVPRIELECFDTRIEALDPTFLWLKDQAHNTWFLFVREEGAFTLDQHGAPGVAINPGGAYYWLQRQSPNGTTFYIYPSIEGSLIVQDTQPPVGTGTASRILLVDRRYVTWDLYASDPPVPSIVLRQERSSFATRGVL